MNHTIIATDGHIEDTSTPMVLDTERAIEWFAAQLRNEQDEATLVLTITTRAS